jgi:predicted nuclease with TOPRIM domain
MDISELVQRREELQAELDDYNEALTDLGMDEVTREDLLDNQADTQDEFDVLNGFLTSLEQSFGNLEEVRLVADEDFRDYAQDTAECIYDIPEHWPYNCIDWDEAAEMLKQDYTSVEWQGVTYWGQVY